MDPRIAPSAGFRSRKVLITALITMACGLSVALGALPSTAAVTVGHSGWFWGDPLPQGQDLRALELFGNRGYAAGAFGTVLRTDDAGATWTGLPSGTIRNITDIDVLSQDTVVVGGGCALRRTDNGGRTFRRLPFTATDTRCSSDIESFDLVTPEVGFILLAEGTVLQTADGGDSFSQRTAVPGTNATGSGGDQARDIVFTAPGTGFAVVSGSDGGKIYRTTDSAASWTLVASPPRGLRGVHFPVAGTGYAVGASNTLLETTNGGATWRSKPLAGAPANNELLDIRCAGAETCLISTAGGERLLRTTNGGDTGASVSPSTRKVFAAAFASGTRAVAVGASGTTVVSDTAGSTFAPVGGRLTGSYGRLRANSATTAYAAGLNGRIARTVDGGRTWSSVGVSTADTIVDMSFLPSGTVGFSIDASGSAFRTNNAGASWRILNTGSAVRPRAVLAPDARRVLLVGPRGIRRSTDGGEQFSAVRSPAVRRAALGDVDRAGSAVFVFGTGALAVSSDGGRKFKSVRRPKGSIRDVDFLSRRTGYLVTTSGGLYVTRNGGRKWAEIVSAGTNDITDLAFSTPSNGFLSTPVQDGSGVLRTTDGGRTWQPQLVTQGDSLSIAAAGRRVGFALESSGGSPGVDDRFFATNSGGNGGTASVLTIRANSRRVRRGAPVTISGRLRPAKGGEFVEVAMRSNGRWTGKFVRVASNGTFTALFRARSESQFVAQWRGDDARRGDGTPALTVTIGAKKRKKGRGR